MSPKKSSRQVPFQKSLFWDFLALCRNGYERQSKQSPQNDGKHQRIETVCHASTGHRGWKLRCIRIIIIGTTS